MIINEQIALYLNDNNLGIYDKDGITGNIYINKLPEKENGISIISVGGSKIGNELGLGIYRKGILIRIRGDKNGIESEELAENIYNELIGFEGYLTENGDRIILLKMLEGGIDVLGLDKNGNVIMGIKISVIYESDKGTHNNSY